MQRYYETVIDTLTGAAVAGAQVWVFHSVDNTLADVWTDALGTAPAGNPIITDSNGFFEFYAADGLYTFEYRSAAEVSLRTITDVAIFDLVDLRADVDDVLARMTAAETAIGTKLNAAAVSAFGLTLVDDADAPTARTTLGVYSTAQVDAAIAAAVAGAPVSIADQTILGNNSGGVHAPIALTVAQTKTLLGLGTMALEAAASYYTSAATDAAIAAAIAAAAPVLYYNYGGFAVQNILASEIVMDHIATVAHTLQANLVGCRVSVGTNPAATFALDVQKNGASIGTISIANTGVVTLTTVGGTAKAIVAGDVVTIIAPAGVDASIARLRFTLRGTI
jgi:hypothetical protein